MTDQSWNEESFCELKTHRRTHRGGKKVLMSFLHDMLFIFFCEIPFHNFCKFFLLFFPLLICKTSWYFKYSHILYVMYLGYIFSQITICFWLLMMSFFFLNWIFNACVKLNLLFFLLWLSFWLERFFFLHLTF